VGRARAAHHGPALATMMLKKVIGERRCDKALFLTMNSICDELIVML
jgi:hypothetical protein